MTLIPPTLLLSLSYLIMATPSLTSSLSLLPPLKTATTMSLLPLFVKSLVRLLDSLVRRPAASVTTILYHGDVLPRNSSLQRLVCNDLMCDENSHLFRFIVGFLRCFW